MLVKDDTVFGEIKELNSVLFRETGFTKMCNTLTNTFMSKSPNVQVMLILVNKTFVSNNLLFKHIIYHNCF